MFYVVVSVINGDLNKIHGVFDTHTKASEAQFKLQSETPNIMIQIKEFIANRIGDEILWF